MCKFVEVDMKKLDFEQCGNKEIKKYYAIFDTAYKNLEDAQKIEDEWANKDTVKPVYLILEKDDEPDLIVLPESGTPHDYDFDVLEEEFTTDYARKCHACGAYFEEGYIVADCDAYCERGCLYTVYANEAEYLEAYENDEAFWTTFWD